MTSSDDIDGDQEEGLKNAEGLGDEEESTEKGRDEEEEGKEEEEDQEEGFEPELFGHIFRRMSERPVNVRVHDVKVKGNVKTKGCVIEAVLRDVKKAQTIQELLQAAAKANAQLESMGIFERCVISLDPGPKELPGTANVIVDLEEVKRTYAGDIGFYSKPETRNWTFEGSMKWRNLFGYGETWDGTGRYALDTTSEMSVGLHYPRFKGLPASLISRIFLLTQDWQRYSSYKERLVGLSIGLTAERYHEIGYNITWRTLQDPLRRASHSVCRQLGHALLSSVKYSFKIDRRDSSFRPMQGYAFTSTTQVAGIGPDSNLLRFVRQELELRYAIPLGFFKTALNFGLSGGIVIPWGRDFRTQVTPISDRFFMGGHSSLVCDLKGPTTLLGFRSRGVGPTDVRRAKSTSLEESAVQRQGRDILGGDLAVTGFADLSFDLPLSFLRQFGIHGHCFICAGNLVGLTGKEYESFSLKTFLSCFRYSVGGGIVIPLRLFRFEVNYCHVLRQFDGDRGKQGIQLSLSPN